MGGGGSRCSKRDIIEPKPSVDMNVGVTIAGSEGCASCSLSFPQGNTASAANMTRDHNTIVLRPFSPFTGTFNQRQFTFREVRLYHPAPLRVEGVQADAVLQCTDGNNIMMFIPLMRSGGFESSSAFLSAVAAQLDPTTSRGLGIVNTDTGAYEQPDIVTGQDWSLTNLVSGTDPYFTWTNSDLEQVVKSDSECLRYIGWASKPGAQVIYFQNPVAIAAADLGKLTAVVGAVMPSDVLATVTHPLYSSGQANCPTPLPKMKPQTFSIDSGLSSIFAYFLVAGAVMFGVVLAVSLVNSGSFDDFAKQFSGMFKWSAASQAPPPEVQVVDGVTGLLKGATGLATSTAQQAMAPAVALQSTALRSLSEFH